MQRLAIDDRLTASLNAIRDLSEKTSLVLYNSTIRRTHLGHSIPRGFSLALVFKEDFFRVTVLKSVKVNKKDEKHALY